MWDALAAWFQSPAGQRVVLSSVVPAAAILIAGVLAALIARSAVRGLLHRFDQDAAASAVAGLLYAATVSAGWNDADPEERRRAQRLHTESDVRVRLLPRPGAARAADWAALRIVALRGSETGQDGQAQLDQLRARLLEWLARPRRAKRLFAESPQRPPAERAAPSTAAPSAPEPPPVEPAAEAETPEQQAPTAVSVAPADAATPAPPPASPPQVGEAEPEPERAAPEETAAEADLPQLPSTEPVTVQRPRLGEAREPALPEEGAARSEKARHARGEQEATQPPPVPAKAPTPAWLDDYDDDADVTQSMNLKTPPPVAATSVRDRRHTGDNILPRN